MWFKLGLSDPHSWCFEIEASASRMERSSKIRVMVVASVCEGETYPQAWPLLQFLLQSLTSFSRPGLPPPMLSGSSPDFGRWLFVPSSQNSFLLFTIRAPNWHVIFKVLWPDEATQGNSTEKEGWRRGWVLLYRSHNWKKDLETATDWIVPPQNSCWNHVLPPSIIVFGDEAFGK